ncbi:MULTISPECIES: DUF2190 family protein [Klebsiella]|uniref:DUF2190 family protein n=1 Tax=Klebsiella TaxID=570 RepID=UPI0018890A48|nr:MULTISPECIES: capsid cement protein [Klebsiella]MBF1894758.1 DUF2190 family protein [Klebsiella oxytoca]MBF1901138.1 DUF2190 family protein [Klebsiella oxytoca]MBF9154335.1 DUF2190 family protein [Klebsiella oxytoca]MBF9212320.1 DUF2190 family protein [Klebsiella oxytoca]MBS2889499.1 DUF2190 family protein [Klebsiella pneumoniae]
MAKNFVEIGETIDVKNATGDVIKSGSPVTAGELVVVALTDIQPDDYGAAMAVGVFSLPKLSTDAITAGARVYLKDGKIQLDSASAVAAGIAWEDADADTTAVAVKLNV